MALYELGEGILQTHVTWEEIEEKCREVFGDDLRFGAKKSAKAIGDGRGFLSKMCLIDPDWTSDVGEDVPKSFIVKVCCLLQMVQAQEHFKDDQVNFDAFTAAEMMKTMEASALKVHNAEVRLYKILDNHNVTTFPRPKMYGSRIFTEENKSKGYIIMSYIDGTENISLQHNLSFEDLKQPLRAIAAMEAVSLNLTDEERKSFTMNPFTDLFAPLFSPEMIKSMIDLFRQYGGAELADRIDKFEKIVPEILDVPGIMKIPSDLGMTDVLVHGDLWSTNMLWKKKSDGHHDLAAILDYQTAHIGMPGQDICRLLGATMRGKERQEQWETITDTFYSYLQEEVGDVAKMPFTCEQLKESMRRYMPMAHFMLAPMIGPVMEFNSRLHGNQMSPEERDVILEKAGALLDDIITYNTRNQELKAKLAFGSSS